MGGAQRRRKRSGARRATETDDDDDDDSRTLGEPYEVVVLNYLLDERQRVPLAVALQTFSERKKDM